MAYRRGFKKEANETAMEVRAELGLHYLDVFDPLALAAHLDISVWTLSRMEPGSVLLTTESTSFSAATVFAGRERTIIHNDSHAPTRQRSNISHELSHAILMHPASPPLDNRGCRDWDQDIEDEATWLAGVLLITEPAAMDLAAKIQSGKLSQPDAARMMGVSPALLQQRLNLTGAFLRINRRRNYSNSN